MFKNLLKNIKSFISGIKVGGYTIGELFKGRGSNRDNTERSLRQVVKNAILNDKSTDDFIVDIDKAIKKRKQHTLITVKNALSASRQASYMAMTDEKDVRYYENIGALDSNQTAVCAGYVGRRWYMRWSQIPAIDKPPRTSVTYHPCRSFIRPVKIGQKSVGQKSYLDELKRNPELLEEWVGKRKAELINSGELQVNTFSQLERIKLFSIDNLMK